MQTQADIDDALIAQFLGTRYLGRRYLRYAELEQIGICDNRASLENWIKAGGFPAGIKIPSRYGKTLVWHAVEVARHIAQRVAERDASSASPQLKRPGDEPGRSKEAKAANPASHVHTGRGTFATVRQESRDAANRALAHGLRTERHSQAGPCRT